MNNRMILFLLFFFGLMQSIHLYQPAKSQVSSQPNQYDWLVTIESRPAPKAFNYEGATLNPVYKAAVTVTPATSDDSGNPTAYEEFWGARGKMLAVERQAAFVPSGDSVAMTLSYETDDDSEPDHIAYEQTQIAVGAMLRVLLDTQINRNPLLYLEVPSQVYSDVLQAMQEQHFVVFTAGPETPIPGAIILYVVDEAGSQRSTLYFPL